MCVCLKETTIKSPWELWSGNSHRETSYFAVHGDAPKVQIAFRTLPGNAPRLLVAERYDLFWWFGS